jgi:predicted RNA-binding protein with RPS1 domain
MLHPDRNQVVEVKGASTGSGYLIAPGLILTANHVAGAEAVVQVTALAEHLALRDPPPRPACVLWRSDDPDLDFALLQTDEPAAGEVYPARWDELPFFGDLLVYAIGFPDAAFFNELPEDPTTRRYDTDYIAGKVFAGSNLIALSQGKGSVVVQVSSPPPRTAAGWHGVSGAAVFDKSGALVGIVKEHGDAVNILRMLPAARLFAQPGVAEALGRAGIAPLRQAPRRPEGFVPVADEETPGRGLRAYLSGDRLPYLNRPETHPAHEDALLEELVKGEVPGIIVTGLGGVGKTRLCLELGLRAYKRGWPVFRVTPRAKPSPQELRELAAGADAARPVLLIFDYLETIPRFLEILGQLGDLHAEHHNLRFIANCRPSFYSATDFRDIDPKRVELLDKGEWQKAVTSHILKTFGIPEDTRTEKLCRGRPAFAVLLAYLKERDPSGDDLRALLYNESGFPDWLQTRLHKSFPERNLNELREELARLMALLPLSGTQRARLGEPFPRILRTLDQDGWIAEEDSPDSNKWLAIALDVFADEIIKRELDERKTIWDDFVKATFAQAREIGCLASSYRAFQRLADPYTELSAPVDNRARQDRWLEIFRGEIADEPAAWWPLLGLVLHGPLLRLEQVAVLIRDIVVRYADWIDYPGVRLAVGRLARALATSPKFFDESTSDCIKRSIIATLEADPENNYLLTSGFRLLQNRYRSRVLEYITTYPERFATHFLLFRWLKQGEPIKEVQEPLRIWLDHFKTTLNASFVIAGWLDAGGNADFVESDIAEWLTAHAEHISASYVYYGWLRAGGSLDLVADGIERWRKRHRGERQAGSVYAGLLHADVAPETIREELLAWLSSNEKEDWASFVYCEWLDHNGDADAIGSHIRAWLDEHGTNLKASHVYRAWLRCGGSRDAIAAKIDAWLRLHHSEREAGSVYGGLLHSGVAPETIREQLLAWLASYQREDGASFVYCDWLDKGGGAAAIGSHVRAWLDQHRANLEASHVYRAWLDAGGAVDAVREDIDAWRDEHRGSLAAAFVYRRSWLEARAGCQAVRTEVGAWLSQYWDRIAAYQVIDACLAANQPFAIVQQAVQQILDWCFSNAKTHGAIQRLSRFGDALEHREIAPHAIGTALRIAELMPEDLQLRDADFFDGVVGRFSEAAVNLPEIREDFERMFLRWLEYPLSFNAHGEIFFPNQHKELVVSLRRLIENGKIGFDAEPVRRFYAWVLRWQGFTVQGARKIDGAPTPATWDRLEEGFAARRAVEGVILYPVRGGFAVDLGGALAFLRGSEVDIGPVADLVPLLRAPQSFRIVKLDRANYDIVVSRRRIQQVPRMAAQEAGAILDGIIKNLTQTGAFVDFDGFDGMVPRKEICWRRINHPSEVLAIGQTVRVQVLGFDHKKEQLLLSIKRIEADPWQGIEARYPTGTRCRGRVRNIVDYGAFVELEPGVEGLVHQSEMSWTIKKPEPRTIVEIAQEVEVVVLDIDPLGHKLKLGLKQALPNPWHGAASKYPVGARCRGRVRNVVDYGAFVELEPGVVGLVHRSEMSRTEKGVDPRRVLSKGQDVEVMVLDVDPQKQQVSLGLKTDLGQSLGSVR